MTARPAPGARASGQRERHRDGDPRVGEPAIDGLDGAAPDLAREMEAEPAGECGHRLGTWGLDDPAPCAWRADLGRALAGTGDVLRPGVRVPTRRDWGAPHSVSDALCALGSVEPGLAGVEMLVEAVDVAAAFPLHRARALVELGATRRRAGERVGARVARREGLDLALICGAAAVARRAHDELVVTGARRSVGASASCPVCEPRGAQALFVSAKTVETTSGTPTAMSGQAPPSPGPNGDLSIVPSADRVDGAGARASGRAGKEHR